MLATNSSYHSRKYDRLCPAEPMTFDPAQNQQKADDCRSLAAPTFSFVIFGRHMLILTACSTNLSVEGVTHEALGSGHATRYGTVQNAAGHRIFERTFRPEVFRGVWLSERQRASLGMGMGSRLRGWARDSMAVSHGLGYCERLARWCRETRAAPSLFYHG